MKVLAFTAYPNEAASTRHRVIQFIEPLADQGIELSVYPFVDSQLNTLLYERSQWIRTLFGLSRALLRRMVDIGRARDADILFVQREAMIFGPPLVEWLAMRVGGCPLVLDLDDALYVRYRSPTYGRLGSALKWFGKTDDLISWSSVVVCGSRAVAEHVRSKNRSAVVIPTVVDTERFRPRAVQPHEPLLVLGWIGTHSTYQYLVSIFPVLQRLARDRRFRLKIIGSGRKQIDIAGVEVEAVSWSLAREISDLQSFDIGLYPLLPDEWAAGKSGFKAVQYMAMGVPFVTMPVGACAEIGEENITHFLARTEDDWCVALAQLLADAKLRLRMGAAGRAYAVKHYSLAAQAQKLGDAFRAAKA